MSNIKDWLQNLDKRSYEAKKRNLEFISDSCESREKKSKAISDSQPAHRRRRRANQNLQEVASPSINTKSFVYDVPENVYKAYYTIQKIIESADLCIQDIYHVPEEERAQRVVIDQIRFDGILQGLLMHAALIDGEFMLEQQLFIERIVQRGHLLNLMKVQTEGRIDLTMEQIAAMSYQEQRKFLNEMDEWIVCELSGRAIVLLVAFEYGNSLSDQGIRMNYLEWMQQCINEIVGFMMQFKGEISFVGKREMEAAATRLLCTPWIEARQNYLG